MDEDQDFRQLLQARIQRYLDMEAQVVSRLTELQQELDDLRKRRKSAEALYRTEFEREVSTTSLSLQAASTEVGPLFGESWADAIVQVLGEAGAPLHVRDIWARIKAGGFTTMSRDPLRTIVTVCLRTSGVVRAGPNQYGLASDRRGEA